MTVNFPGPYQLRIFYETTPPGYATKQHVLQLNLDCSPAPDPGDAFSTISAVKRDAGSIFLAPATDALVAVMVPLFATGEGSVTHAELWKFTPGTFISSYIATYNIAEAFTGIGDNTPAGQDIFTFRATGSGVMKVYLQEPMVTAGPSQAYADMDAAHQAFANIFVNTTNGIYLARNDTYPFLLMHRHPGESEYWFRKRWRS